MESQSAISCYLRGPQASSCRTIETIVLKMSKATLFTKLRRYKRNGVILTFTQLQLRGRLNLRTLFTHTSKDMNTIILYSLLLYITSLCANSVHQRCIDKSIHSEWL